VRVLRASHSKGLSRFFRVPARNRYRFRKTDQKKESGSSGLKPLSRGSPKRAAAESNLIMVFLSNYAS
jgi:hypothetical protein